MGWCMVVPCTHATSNGKGMRETCLDNVASVQDNDTLKQMRNRSGAMPECGIVWDAVADRCMWQAGVKIDFPLGSWGNVGWHDDDVGSTKGKTQCCGIGNFNRNKVVVGCAYSIDFSHKVKVPEPKSFGGARSAKELENFLWNMEQHVKTARISNDEKALITSMYLSGDAQLELRCLSVKDLSSAIAAADGLLDYKLGNPSTSEFKETSLVEKNGKYNSLKFKPKEDNSQSKTGQTNKGCFICDGRIGQMIAPSVRR
ncbi:hypothetical protein Acr_21g0002420 [Actinidia rufa]|uniref:Uncharacterized protein n=1 Tax=Actinidia rufa TaxID=165716 RepID=A0A7J0GFP7_9ERIC|nr:hypothetical protein Acr_21g0002420 [Actinidia rufa]